MHLCSSNGYICETRPITKGEGFDLRTLCLQLTYINAFRRNPLMCASIISRWTSRRGERRTKLAPVLAYSLYRASSETCVCLSTEPKKKV